MHERFTVTSNETETAVAFWRWLTRRTAWLDCLAIWWLMRRYRVVR